MTSVHVTAIGQYVCLAIVDVPDSTAHRIEAAALGNADLGERASLIVRRGDRRGGRIRQDGSESERTSIRRLIAGRTAVAIDAQRVGEALLQSNLQPPGAWIDLGELASALMPREFRHNLARLCRSMSLEPPDPRRDGEGARATSAVFEALAVRLDAYDSETLQRVAALASQAGWTSAGFLYGLVGGRGETSSGDRGERLTSHEIAFLGARDRPESLKPTGNAAKVDSARVRGMLQPLGVVSEVLPGFEHRAVQVVMAEAVNRALNDDGWLIAEAGTGTGKSLAYLLPAALRAVQSGERVVVSTNTRALQDQLLTKDIPDIERIVKEAHAETALVTAALKGRSNSLCLRRWFAADRQPAQSPGEAGMRAKVNLWLPITERGDRAELLLNGEEEGEFHRVSAEGEACVPAKCVFQQRNQCFLYRARREAEAAHVVIVNHALLLSDLGEGSGVLPGYDRLIVDEAHHLEDQATKQFGFSVTDASMWELCDRLVRADGAVTAGLLMDAAVLIARGAPGGANGRDRERAEEMRSRVAMSLEHAHAVKARATEFFATLRDQCLEDGTEEMGYGRSLRVTVGVRNRPSWSGAEIVCDRLNSAFRELEKDAIWLLNLLERNHRRDDGDAPGIDPFDDAQLNLNVEIQAIADLGSKIAEATLSPDADKVYWIDVASGNERTWFHAAPLHVGDLLREHLFSPLKSVVLTSATLTTDGSFNFVKQRLGCSEAEELDVESPFDYRKSALLYLVNDVPEPNQPGYAPAVHRAVSELGLQLEGRTLALFTSYAAMRATYAAIKQPLAANGVTVLAQRIDGSPQQLVERLRSDSRVVVLGTATFWEGVDVVGAALSALIIAKLPFSVPSDPVFAARSELFEQPFQEFAVPQAVLKFKQGFGRLIRSGRDRGVCVVLDRRLLSKRYGTSFVKSLPGCTVEVGSSDDLSARTAQWLSVS